MSLRNSRYDNAYWCCVFLLLVCNCVLESVTTPAGVAFPRQLRIVVRLQVLRHILVLRFPHPENSRSPKGVTTLDGACVSLHLVCSCAPKGVTMHAGAVLPYFSCAITCQKVLRRQLVLRFQTSVNSCEPQGVTPRVGLAFACISCVFAFPHVLRCLLVVRHPSCRVVTRLRRYAPCWCFVLFSRL